MLSPGEKVLVITRRLFEKDLRRHFVGQITHASSTIMRVEGFALVFDDAIQDFIRINEVRTRIFPLLDSGLIIIFIPGEVDLSKLNYQTGLEHKRYLSDKKGFSMNVSEFGAFR